MKFRPFVLLAFVAAAGLAACSEEIAGLGDPFAIMTNRSTTTVARDVPFSVQAWVIDQNNRRIPGALSGSLSSTTNISLDSTVYVSELSETRFFMRGTGAIAAPGVDLVITGQGLTDTTHVIVQ